MTDIRFHFSTTLSCNRKTGCQQYVTKSSLSRVGRYCPSLCIQARQTAGHPISVRVGQRNATLFTHQLLMEILCPEEAGIDGGPLPARVGRWRPFAYLRGWQKPLSAAFSAASAGLSIVSCLRTNSHSSGSRRPMLRGMRRSDGVLSSPG